MTCPTTSHLDSPFSRAVDGNGLGCLLTLLSVSVATIVDSTCRQMFGQLILDPAPRKPNGAKVTYRYEFKCR